MHMQARTQGGGGGVEHPPSNFCQVVKLVLMCIMRRPGVLKLFLWRSRSDFYESCKVRNDTCILKIMRLVFGLYLIQGELLQLKKNRTASASTRLNRVSWKITPNILEFEGIFLKLSKCLLRGFLIWMNRYDVLIYINYWVGLFCFLMDPYNMAELERPGREKKRLFLKWNERALSSMSNSPFISFFLSK